MIAPYRDGDMREEYYQIPRRWRGSGKGYGGREPDEVVAQLAELYPQLGIRTEDDLYDYR